MTVGDDGAVSTSFNGIQWTRRTSGTSQTLYGVAGKDSLLVAVGNNGTLLRSNNGGETWEAREVGTTRTFYGVLRTDGLFVAVGSQGILYTSPDGNDWTSRFTNTTTDINAAAWNGNRIVVVGDNGLIEVSSDGVVWTEHTVNTFGEDVDAVTWTGTHFVAMGEHGVQLTSPDGLAWSAWAGPGTVTGVAWDGAKLVAVGADGGAWTSPAGNTWNPDFPGTSQTLRAVTWTGGRLIAVGGGGVLYTVETSEVVATPPAAPVPGSPQEGVTGVSLVARLTWSGSTEAVSYHVQIAADSGFSTVHIDTLVSEASLNVLLAEYGATYYWRVAAVNAAGTGAYSHIRRFETEAAPTTSPPAPVLIAPAAFAANVPLEAQLRWQAAASATRYRVQVSLSPDFSSRVLDDSTLGVLSRTVALDGNREYYWRVRGWNVVGTGPWSEIRAFVTIPTPPAAPTLLHPAQFAADVPVSAAFRWARTAGATSYRLQLSKLPDFSGGVTSVNAADTQAVVGTLEGLTVYYWRVRASNSAVSGSSPYSEVRRFTTGILPPPDVPVLVSPAPYASASAASTILLKWDASAYAMSYRLQLSTTPDFSTLLRGDSGVTGLSRNVGSLPGGAQYYWRVQAVNASGSSGWSEIRNFSIADPPPLALAPGVLGLHRESGSGARLRFVLERPEYVTIRVSDARGREAMPVFDRMMGAGVHEVPLAPALADAWYVLDFRAGERREVLKFRP